jgi:membrane protease YdiL (CAAX protease family)
MSDVTTASSDMVHRLAQADNVLYWSGAAIATAWLAWRLIKRLGDPLKNAPRPGRRLDAGGAFLPMLIFLFFATLLTTVTQSFAPDSPALIMFADYAARACGAVACLWVARMTFDGGARAFLFGSGDGGGRSILKTIGSGAAMFLVAMFVCPTILYATVWSIETWWPNYVVFEHEVIRRLREDAVPMPLVWIGTGLLVPFSEEAFFRGMGQTLLGNVLRSRWLVVVFSGLLFGVIHVGGGETPQPHVGPAIAALGILLGAVYLRTGSLVAPVVLHALFNCKTLLWESLGAAGS